MLQRLRAFGQHSEVARLPRGVSVFARFWGAWEHFRARPGLPPHPGRAAAPAERPSPKGLGFPSDRIRTTLKAPTDGVEADSP